MAQKTVVLVGRDAAPSKFFNLMKPELEKAGWNVLSFIGHGKDVAVKPLELSGIISGADLVLCGMSAPAQNAQVEISAAGEACFYGKPYGFYADTWGASARPWFENVRGKASFIFVLNNEDEVEKTKSLYPVARVLKSGNPEWEEASVPVYSREEIRIKLGIAMESKVVLVPGHKSLPITNFLLVSTLHALHNYGEADLVYAPHPGDGVSPMMYRDVVEFSDVRVLIVGKDKMVLKENGKVVEREGGYPTGHLLPAADVMVESASTFCMAAAIQRVPIVSFFSEVSKLRNIPTFGQREWEPVEQGVAVEVYGDLDELGEEICLLLERPHELQGRQEELYPPQEQGRAVRMVVKELERQFYRPRA